MDVKTYKFNQIMMNENQGVYTVKIGDAIVVVDGYVAKIDAQLGVYVYGTPTSINCDATVEAALLDRTVLQGDADI
ncbi:MAG: hypothetical protein QXP84_04930 [Candidatus Korarchaeum sp.]